MLITVLETRPEEDLTQELVKNKLLKEYCRRTEQASVQREVDNQKALKTSINVHKQGQQQSKQVNKLLCYFYNKPNHMKKECRKYIEWKKKHPDHKAKAVCINNKITEPNDNEDLYSCFSVEQENVNKMNSNWYIDSGAISHMCSDISLFQKFDETYKSQVTLVNGHKLQVADKGEILLRSNTEKKFSATNSIKLMNILYIPVLIGHLISVKVLTSKGYEVTSRNNECVIIRGNQLSPLQQNG